MADAASPATRTRKRSAAAQKKPAAARKKAAPARKAPAAGNSGSKPAARKPRKAAAKPAARKPRKPRKAAAKPAAKAATKSAAKSAPKPPPRADGAEAHAADADGAPFFMGGLQRQGGKIAEGWQQLLSQLAGRPELMAEAVRQQVDTHNRLVGELAEAIRVREGDEEAAEAQAEPAPAKPKRPDPRFANPLWESHPFYRYMRESYDAYCKALRSLPDQVELDPVQRQAVDLVMDQLLSALAPSNFAATNPEVVVETIESGGRNLQEGLSNYLADMKRGMITQTDRDAFAVGESLAITPGKVVLRAPLFELIEYAPATAEVASEPLLVIPPCINKYYILDLQPHNSFIKHLVSRGVRVFLVSWINASPEHRNLGWDDYVEDGVIAAAEAAREIAGGKLHTLGYCIGGTLLACAACVLKARGKDWFASMSLLTAFLDFCDTGKVGLFVDPNMVEEHERRNAQGGIFPGIELARTFAFVRPNDLVWPYVVNNYLLGKRPKPFDILFWNADSTNLPGPLYAWYLRHTYHQNDLKDGQVEVCGHKMDMPSIGLPGIAVSCERDHIVPWQAAYESARLLGDQVGFIQASAGHVAGVVNPPAKRKGRHFSNNGGGFKATPEEWLEAASEHPGSWWDTFADWLHSQSSGKVPAPKRCGSAQHRPIADAPGAYVRAPLPPTE